MSTFAVTVEELEVSPHPDADRLELAQIGGYSVVVGKGQFKTGDKAFYIPEQAILPDWLIEAMGLTGKLSGSKKNRVKAVKLRGVLSQGLVAPVDILKEEGVLPGWELLDGMGVLGEMVSSGQDFAEFLDIKKWEPEIPASMSGQVAPGADVLRWTDIENIQRHPEIFEDGEPVVVTEKVHGTCLIMKAFKTEDGVDIEVSSKGLAAKGLTLQQDENNLYWKAVLENKLDVLANDMLSYMNHNITGLALYGEVYGTGVQDLGYGTEKGKPKFALFDAQARFQDGTETWVPTYELDHILGNIGSNMPQAPILYVGPYDLEEIRKIASGKEQMSGTEANLREGVVIRAENPNDTWGRGRRKIAKFVTDEYLTRKNGTEYN